jgi:O-antigen/teichoic acid export membrane protein
MDPERRSKDKKKIKNYFLKINADNLLTNIGQVGINSIIIAFVNMLLQLILTRTLGPAQYGEIATLLTINSMIVIAVSSVALIVTRFISYYKTRQQYDKMKFLAYWAFIFFFIFGIASAIITIILSGTISEFLNVSDKYILIIFSLLVCISFLTPIIEGILKGLQEFMFMGRYKLTEAVSRLIIVAIFIFIGLRIKSIILGMVLGSLITILYSGNILKKIYISNPYKTSTMDFYRYATPAIIGCVALAILSNIDLIFARHFFDAILVGNYAAASMLAKVSFGIAFGSAGVMFPKVVEYYSDGDMTRARKTMQNTLKIMVVLGGAINLLLILFPNFISKIIFGKQYSVGAILPVYGAAVFMLSITTILFIYDLATKKYGSIAIMVCAAFIEIYQIIISHESIMNLVWTIFTINILVMLFMTIKNYKEILAR